MTEHVNSAPNTALSTTIPVGRCARCGDDHPKVKFVKTATPYYFPDDLKKKDPHWYEGICPKTSEVIYMTQYTAPTPYATEMAPE